MIINLSRSKLSLIFFAFLINVSYSQIYILTGEEIRKTKLLTMHPSESYDDLFELAPKPIPITDYSEKARAYQKWVNSEAEGIVSCHPLGKDTEWTSIDFEEITPYTWRWIDFSMVADSSAKIYLRRPISWIRGLGVSSIGDTVSLDLPQMGIQGTAKVLAIRPNHLDTRLWEERREGDFLLRPITGKFVHQSNEVYQLFFKNWQKPLQVTASHPIWSVDQNGWSAVADLKVGERVKTRDGEVCLNKMERLPKNEHTVYNLEVYRDHNYLVSRDKILVHNECWNDEWTKLMKKMVDGDELDKAFGLKRRRDVRQVMQGSDRVHRMIVDPTTFDDGMVSMVENAWGGNMDFAIEEGMKRMVVKVEITHLGVAERLVMEETARIEGFSKGAIETINPWSLPGADSQFMTFTKDLDTAAKIIDGN